MLVFYCPPCRRQPFYHVLVDTNDRPSSTGAYASTYVAQENIEIPKVWCQLLRFENGTCRTQAAMELRQT